MKILVIFLLSFLSSFAFAADRKIASTSKGDLGMKIRIDDEQAKNLYFKLESKGVKPADGKRGAIIRLQHNNVVCDAVNSHGASTLEGFSCEIDL